MYKHLKFLVLSLFLMPMFVSCNEEVTPDGLAITFNPEVLNFAVDAGTDTVKVSMNGASWEVSSNQTWCTISKKVSTHQQDSLIISVSANIGSTSRSAKLIFSVNNGELKDTLLVTQAIRVYNYPDYSDSIPGDRTGMNSSAKVLAAKMYAGWNMGNSLEVPGNETGWGNAKATQMLMDSVKAAGFNTVRLPCAWDSHLEDAAICKIDVDWLARVKEVIGYCVKNDMYVILNIHWDGGWLENNPTYAKQISVNAKQKAYWEQIAMYMRDFDEHLLFAGTNEVHANYGTPTVENNTVQQSFNQTFVTAVRSCGGKNLYRNIVVQGYNTNIDHSISFLKLPKDPTTSRTFVEVHFYDPWDYCGDTNSNIYLWGAPYKQYGAVSSWGQESNVVSKFGAMKTNYVDKGYPVILGEYSPTRRSSLTGSALTYHLASRAYYSSYVTEQAKAFGMVPCYWDNGGLDNFACGIFNRATGQVFDRQVLNGIMSGAGKGHYPY